MKHLLAQKIKNIQNLLGEIRVNILLAELSAIIGSFAVPESRLLFLTFFFFVILLVYFLAL